MHKTPKILFLIVFFFSSLVARTEAQVPEEAPPGKILKQLGAMEERLRKIETTQTQIRARDKEILQRIDAVRIEVHHAPKRTRRG